MRSKYYVITAFSVSEDRRVIAHETDWMLSAFCKWWELKSNSDYKHMIMTIRED